MPGRAENGGRKVPTLYGQDCIHLVLVYDMRQGKKRLRYAYWSNGEWKTNSSKNEALQLSIKANGEDPYWRPPSHKEGHIIAIDKENVPAPERTTGKGSWLDFSQHPSPQHPSRRSCNTKSTRSSSGASSASSGPPSDPAKLKEYSKAQKVKKSQKKRDARSMKSQRKMHSEMNSKIESLESLLSTGFEQSESRATSRATDVLNAIVTGTDAVTDAVLEAANKAAKDTQQVLETTKEGIRQAQLAATEVEDQRLKDSQAATKKANEEEDAKIKEKRALQEAKQQQEEAKAAAKKVKLDEKWARDVAEKAEREAAAKAASSAMLVSISMEVGTAVGGKVSEVIEAIEEVKRVVDNTNEAAALAAEAAVIGADASKDTKEVVEAFTRDFPATVEASLTAAMRKERTMDNLISTIVDEKELNEGLAQLKTEVARLGQQWQQHAAVSQRNAVGPRAGSAPVRNPAPAPAPSTRSGATRSGATRSGATRNGAAAATRNGAAAATTARKQAAPPRERLPVLKGEFGKLVRQDVATLSDGKKGEDGAWKVKINILASVPQLLLQAQQEDQLLATLAALVKGITTVLEPKAANENQLIAAALAAIYAIYNSLEANSNEMELVAATLVPSLLKATDKKVQGARQASTQFGKAVVALVGLAAPSERVLEAMLPRLYAKELTGDNECLWTANALGSYVRATPQQVEPPTPEMYGVSQGLLHLLGHKSDQVRDAAISSVCDLAKVNKGLAISLAETKHMNKQLAEKLGKAVKAATAHYTAVELGSPLSS